LSAVCHGYFGNLLAFADFIQLAIDPRSNTVGGFEQEATEGTERSTVLKMKILIKYLCKLSLARLTCMARLTCINHL
jgi:hypothetical protein